MKPQRDCLYVTARPTGREAHGALFRVTAGWALLLALLASLAACGPEEEPEATPLPYFGGVWHGTLVEATTGNTGDVQLTVNQDGATLTGTWTAVFSSGFINGGTLSGNVSSAGATAHVDLYSSEPGFCPMRATVEVLVGHAWGNYTTIYCDELSTGSIELNRGPGGDLTPPAPEPDPGSDPAPGPGVAESTPNPGLWKAPTYTGGTAKLEILHSGSAWSVHGWGFCGGTYTSYCDWGTVAATVLADGRLHALWNFGFKTTELWASLSDSQPGVMETAMFHNYAPGDPRPDRWSYESFVYSP